MANRRMIASNIFTDEFFCELSITERLLWIGLIAQCADDQGRLQDKPNLINSRIFPDDGLPIETINNGLDKFATSKKIIRYSIGNKNLIQITKWWTYQTPSWAAASIYPHPPDWTDRVKVHVAGNKVHTENWETPGGYLTSLPTAVGTPLPTAVPTGIKDVKGDVKGEGEGKDLPPNIFVEADLVEYQQVFEKDTGLSTYRIDQAFEVWSKMKADGVTPQDMHIGTQELLHSDKTYTIVRPQSVMNAAYTAKQKRVYEESKRIPEIAKPIVSLEECLRLEKLNEERYNNA